MVAGYGMSDKEVSQVSLSVLEAFASEHTTAQRMARLDWFAHSRIVCATSAIEGARKRTVEPSGKSSSVSRRDVSVLPVPHAMISWPRSLSSKPARHASMASRW